MKLNLGSINDSIVIDKFLCEDNIYHIHCHVRGKYVERPKCHKLTKSVHSTHVRHIQDLPIQGKTVILELTTRHLHCHQCKSIFTEPISFAPATAHMTERLKDKIIEVSVVTSSLNAEKILSSNGIRIKKSAICEIIKKNDVDSE